DARGYDPMGLPPIYQKKKQINPLAGGRQSGLARAWQYTALLDIWERNIWGCKSFPGTVFYAGTSE
ncbi:hypothetical protein, partial [Candidatus Avelusimicrobium alvi]|uniref:hypothetical protein n=1 Tax=Candidatus Avelusimicrobium alvi TaxID=3416221 RepID=UPI003D140033